MLGGPLELSIEGQGGLASGFLIRQPHIALQLGQLRQNDDGFLELVVETKRMRGVFVVENAGELVGRLFEITTHLVRLHVHPLDGRVRVLHTAVAPHSESVAHKM